MSRVLLFEVYTARFPFLDINKDKIRPIIVVSKPYGQHNTITVIPVSSKHKQESAEVQLHDWHQAGLVKPSVARVYRLTTILRSDLTNKLGILSESDKENIKQAIKKLLDL